MLRQGLELYQCQLCQNLLQSRSSTKYRRCSSCGSRRLTKIEPLEGEQLHCPLCKEKQLQLQECGLWD